MALSSDSSCAQNLDNSTSGYETLVLSKIPNQKKMPNYVKTHVATLVYFLNFFFIYDLASHRHLDHLATSIFFIVSTD